MQVSKILEAVKNAYKKMQSAFDFKKTTDELFAFFCSDLDEAIGEYEICYDFVWGKDSANIEGVTKNYIPQKGDTLIMDISVKKDGVWCDVCRTFFVGEPTEAQKADYEMIIRSIRAGHKALKVGIKASDMYREVNTVYERNGEKLVHHAGHKIADIPVAQPQFLPENDTILERGVYAIESGIYREGLYGIRLENDFLVNENGAEDLFESLMPLDIKEYILQ